MTQINAFRLISSEINFFCTNFSLAKNEELIMMDMLDMFIKKKKQSKLSGFFMFRFIDKL